MKFSILYLLSSILFLAGCQTATVPEPLTAQLAGNEPENQLEFWHTLASRPVTSNDEAFHGLLLFIDGTDPAADYPGRVEALRTKGLLPHPFDIKHQPANAAVTRGTLAVAISRFLNIRGGLFNRLTGGHSPRYATRELQFQDLYPPSTPNQTFSGSEFLGIIGRIEDHQLANPANAPASVLPGEMNAPAR